MSNSFYIFIESVWHNYEAGGVVMLPILIAGVIGFYYLYCCYGRIGRDAFRKDAGGIVDQLRTDLQSTTSLGAQKSPVTMALRHLRKRGGILSREMRYALDVACKNPAEYQDYMQVRMIKTCRYMEKGLHIVSVMSAAAPLLGLLGTVTGMVSTFEMITLYGNQNPVLMADGISEALISTQSGLLIAFPLTLLKGSLYERIELLKNQMTLGATVIENFISAKSTQVSAELEKA